MYFFKQTISLHQSFLFASVTYD